MTRLLCVGHSTIDTIYQVGAIPSTPTKVLANAYTDAAVGEGLRRMQKIAGGMVGVTLGADGFLWLDAGHEQRAPVRADVEALLRSARGE